VLALSWLGALVVFAVTADLWPLDPPEAISNEFSRSPGLRFDEPLGTDQLGRSELSRIIYGARVSLAVALGATTLGLTAGLALGLAVGYVRGFADHLFDVATNTLLAFPPLVFLIVVTTVLPTSVWSLTAALGIVTMPTFARIARANALALAPREYVVAARALGFSRTRIIVRELLPNVFLPVASYAVIVLAGMIVAEGSLSFLGLGVPPPTPSWGGMIAAGREHIAREPYLVFVPGAFLFLTVLATNTCGDWARSRTARESAL
jgi:peptide/nickel transport system permease protein